MPFRIAQKTLESLEWPLIVARLRGHCRTPQARLRLAAGEGTELQPDDSASSHTVAGTELLEIGALRGDPEEAAHLAELEPAHECGREEFAQSPAAVRERLTETSEARALLDAEEIPPIGGVAELEATFRRAGKGGTLAPQQLLELGSTLHAIHDTERFLVRRSEAAPHLAALAETIEGQRDLEQQIDRCIDPSGEVRDGASPALAEARKETNRLSGELQRRLARYLQNPDIKSNLSDDYYTVRNDRYVLPVRSDARGKVPGIVHDASRSGTTVFIEPEAVVDLNNRLKQAEFTVIRETERVLRDLTDQVRSVLPSLRSDLDGLEAIDLAFARGRLSREMEAVEPLVEPDGVFELIQLRHPMLPHAEAVANDMRLGTGFTVLVLSGPNAGGKTVAMKAVALAALFARAGLHVPAAPGARVALVDTILADIGDSQDMGENLSTFSAHMMSLAHMVRSASVQTLVVIDEIGVGTDPGEGAALAQAVLETLADSGARVVATTHYNLLKEMASVDERFCNASVEFDPKTLAPTYRLRMGDPGVSSARAVAARMGMPSSVLERAGGLLDREDRRLDRMLSELAASRAALDTEQREVAQLRAESEVTRNDYRNKLERLMERRDKLFHSMRNDLDSAFKDAHSQVAAVIRQLQRGGTAQDAARARGRLQALDEGTRRAQEEAGIGGAEVEPNPRAVDWRRVKPGHRVAVPGGSTGVLESLPDRRGRVGVRVGGARLILPTEKVSALPNDAPSRAAGHARQPVPAAAGPASPLEGGTLHCDLRGLRVSEALDRASEILDRAAADGRDGVEFIHGHGTGALRTAVRQLLASSAYVAEFGPGDAEAGGNGVTRVRIGR